jgi:hypothetical protein
MRTRLIAVLCLGASALVSPCIEGADHWSPWRATDDPEIQWRARVTEFNRNLSPVCEFEFNRPLDGTVDFTYQVRYNAARGATAERKGHAYNITKSEHGGDSVSGCQVIQGVSISAVRIKGRPSPATLQAPKGTTYSVVFSKQVFKAALTECGTNDLGFPHSGVFRRELREYSDSSAGPVIRTWRTTVDVFVRCHEP